MSYIKVDVTADAFESQYHTGCYTLVPFKAVELAFCSAHDTTRSMVVPSCQRAGMYKLTLHCFFPKPEARRHVHNLKLEIFVFDQPGLLFDCTGWTGDEVMSDTWMMTSQRLYLSKPTRVAVQASNKTDANDSVVDVRMFALHVQYLG